MLQTNKFIFSYHGTFNLGDAIQTYALARLLPQPLVCMYRHRMHPIKGDEVIVANGFLCDIPHQSVNTLFAGVYIGGNHSENLAWIRQSRFPVGARDPFTQEYLKKNNIESSMVGCATLTLPRYDGPRKGVLHIDDGRNCPMTHEFPALNWACQWQMAIGSIEMMKRASLVVTKRLHVALPCLAMGTPVYIEGGTEDEVMSPQRFSLLHHLGFKFNEPVTMDVSGIASGYINFLSSNLGVKVEPDDFPEFVSPRGIIAHGHIPLEKK